MADTIPHTPNNALTVRRRVGAFSAEQFQSLADVPAAAVWLANIHNQHTRRAYKGDVEAFIAFCGIERPGGAPVGQPGPRHRLEGAARGLGARRQVALPRHRPQETLGRELAL